MVSFLAVLALNIERFITFKKEFYNLTLNSSDVDSSTRSCDQWFCTSDFVFTVCVLLNLGEALKQLS